VLALEPSRDLGGVEADEPADLEVREAALPYEAADHGRIDGEELGERLGREESRWRGGRWAGSLLASIAG
jgi:hypothetical protein